MAAIKSYTDLEQSRKLAEFLPLESADMCWYLATKGNPKAMFNEGYNGYGDFELPCWSLAALLNVMPQIDEWIIPYGHKYDRLFRFEPKICKMWEHSIMPSYKVTYGNELFTDIYDNPVDACVEMILKLKEKNLL